ARHRRDAAQARDRAGARRGRAAPDAAHRYAERARAGALPAAGIRRLADEADAAEVEKGLEHGQARPGAALDLVVVQPPELELARLLGADEEAQGRVGGDAGAERGAENLDAVVAAGEGVQHVARHALAFEVAPEPGFHRMLDQDAHLDRLAAARFRGNLDARERHQPSSVHAASRTSIWTASDQKLPSDSS